MAFLSTSIDVAADQLNPSRHRPMVRHHPLPAAFAIRIVPATIACGVASCIDVGHQLLVGGLRSCHRFGQSCTKALADRCNSPTLNPTSNS